MLDQTSDQGVKDSEKLTDGREQVRRSDGVFHHDHCDRIREENLDDSLSAGSPSWGVQFISSDNPAHCGAKDLACQVALHCTKEIHGRRQQVQAHDAR